ncbi:MAG: alkaline phosphatase PhoX [Pseudomonadota bacterium]
MVRRSGLTRRGLLKSGAALALGASTTARAFNALAAQGSGRKIDAYGPLRPTPEHTTGLPLLKLPEGFTYRAFGITGAALSDGSETPPRHDGMAVVAERGDQITLIRNHEIGFRTPIGTAATPRYNPEAGGGTTTLIFDGGRGELVESWASLSGTAVNCAGGANPFSESWLTCEEIDEAGTRGKWRTTVDHGFVFEVPGAQPASAVPLTAMGRFVHEAVAVDPTSGIIYQTEDDGLSGFYRFLPQNPRDLAAGGRLEMARVVGSTSAQGAVNLNGQDEPSTRRNWNAAILGLSRGFAIPVGRRFAIDWVPIETPAPTADIDSLDGIGNFQNRVVAEGIAQGGCFFTRGEGCWYDRGSVYFTSTDGGPIGRGQVWQYHVASSTLSLIFASNDPEQLNRPDNLTVARSGALLLCEDSTGNWHPADRMIGLTLSGELFDFAENNLLLEGAAAARLGVPAGDYRTSEWAGATFSRSGKWLFANIQTPGITFAITGPWTRGPLGAKPT